MKTFVDNHRGPFRFLATRMVTKKGQLIGTSVLLKGTIDGADVWDEARALLEDPRDTITSLAVWCEKEEQFIGTITKRGLDKHLNSDDTGEVLQGGVQ